MTARKIKSFGPAEDPVSDAQQQAAALLALKPQVLLRAQGPLYRQLASRLRAPIDAGVLLPGSALPKEAVLASEFGVSLITVRQALRDLEGEVFALPPGTLCYCLRAVLLLNEQPITQSTFYFPPAIGSRLKRGDFDDVVVFRAVQRHLGIKLSRAQIKVRAELADESLGLALDCAPGAAILAMEMLYFSSAGEPVELTLSKNRGDQLSITHNAPNDLV